MCRPFLSIFSFFSLFCLALFIGCGGGGTNPPVDNPTPNPTSTPTGILQNANIALSITWPDPTRFVVPVATQSVRVELRNAQGGVIGTPRIVTRPATGLISNLTFTDVPATNITVSVVAFPNADATGTALSTGNLVVTTQSNQTVNAPVVINSTIASVRINGNDGTNLTVGQTRVLTAQAVNSAGETVLVAPSQWEWTSSNTTNFALTPSGQSVSVAANSVGSTTITLRDKESGRTIASSLSAIANNGGGGGDLSTTKIAFAKNVNFKTHIFVMNGDGTNQTDISNVEAFEFSPIFSPDGKKILFASTRSSPVATLKAEFHIMNIDGTNVVRLTNDPQTFAVWTFAHPVFSPDSTKIVYANGAQKIYRVNTDGTGRSNLTGTADGTSPDFSSDGKKITFVSGRDGNSEVYVMNTDGTQPTRLTNTSVHESAPTFSPDGSKIIFARPSGNDSRLYIMNADGTQQVDLNTPNNHDPLAVFSPDSKKIAFSDGNIYMMNLDGTQKTQITTNATTNSNLNFSPDSKKIIFTSQVNPSDSYSLNLNMINVDGTGETTITPCTQASSSDARNNLSWSVFPR
jgi:Tol biopolymer transport system component